MLISRYNYGATLPPGNKVRHVDAQHRGDAIEVVQVERLSAPKATTQPHLIDTQERCQLRLLHIASYQKHTNLFRDGCTQPYRRP